MLGFLLCLLTLHDWERPRECDFYDEHVEMVACARCGKISFRERSR
jgi:hypothetical protein